MLSFFPRGVLDEILNLIESVSEDFPSYSCSAEPVKYLTNKGCFIARTLVNPKNEQAIVSLINLSDQSI